LKGEVVTAGKQALGHLYRFGHLHSLNGSSGSYSPEKGYSRRSCSKREQAKSPFLVSPGTLQIALPFKLLEMLDH
jgi:hypothetical protein